MATPSKQQLKRLYQIDIQPGGEPRKHHWLVVLLSTWSRDLSAARCVEAGAKPLFKSKSCCSAYSQRKTYCFYVHLQTQCAPAFTGFQASSPPFKLKMRLLNTTTLQLTQFHRDIPPYAILSHTWGDEEVTFQEIDTPEREQKRGWAKVVGCCRQALMDHLDWVWIDACCIDKTSSAELSEAINSMYGWYGKSQLCYAFLEDVPAPNPEFPLDEFKAARWFTRGWCLQELIAPRHVEFYAKDWTEIGTKLSLCRWIQKITLIPKSVLRHRTPWSCSIAQKMSWACQRRTTRVEDEAYCLLGLFDVNMPLLYGEGRRAFFRLQEEIIKRTEDYSFLLWTQDVVSIKQWQEYAKLTEFPIFATGPACFHRDGLVVRERGCFSYQAVQPGLRANRVPKRFSSMDPPQMTSRGLCVSLPCRTARTVLPNSRCLFLWTGFICDGRAVCITVVCDTSAWPKQYVRVGDGEPAVYLVELGDLVHFELEQIYLSAFDRLCPPLPRPPSSVIPELDVVLSSSSGNTITLGVSDSPLRFQKVVLNECPDDEGYTEIWRAAGDERDSMMFLKLIPLSLRTKTGEVSASDDVPSQQVHDLQLHVELGHYPFSCTCAFEVSRLQDATLRSRSMGDSGSDVESNEPSDRAVHRLDSGEVVTASIKNLTRETDLPRFVLRAAVLPRRVDQQEDNRWGAREHIF